MYSTLTSVTNSTTRGEEERRTALCDKKNIKTIVNVRLLCDSTKMILKLYNMQLHPSVYCMYKQKQKSEGIYVYVSKSYGVLNYYVCLELTTGAAASTFSYLDNKMLYFSNLYMYIYTYLYVYVRTCIIISHINMTQLIFVPLVQCTTYICISTVSVHNAYMVHLILLDQYHGIEL